MGLVSSHIGRERAVLRRADDRWLRRKRQEAALEDGASGDENGTSEHGVDEVDR